MKTATSIESNPRQAYPRPRTPPTGLKRDSSNDGLKPGRTLSEVVQSWKPSVVSLDEARAVFETNVFGVTAVTPVSRRLRPSLRRATAGYDRPLVRPHRAVQAVQRQLVVQEMAGRHHLQSDLSAAGRTIRNGDEPWTLRRPPFRFCSRLERRCTPTPLMQGGIHVVALLIYLACEAGCRRCRSTSRSRGPPQSAR